MPFYEYQCQACGGQTEVLQKISDAPLRKCPDCGKSKLVKLVSAPVFRLKGGGWYETDFKTDQDKKRNLAGAERDSAPASEGDSASKSAAEPAKKESAAKPEAKPQAKSVAKPKAKAVKSGKKAKARK